MVNINQRQYVVASLETHLFFGRVMKEHALFLEAGFTPKNPDFGKAADQYKGVFETILSQAAELGGGIVSPQVISSGEIITDYTLGSEQKTQNFTGIPINTDITRVQSRLYGAENPNITPELTQQVRQLNARARHYLTGLISFKTKILNDVLSCAMFIAHYPSIVAHMIREANLYQSQITELENGMTPDSEAKEAESFWNRNMMEHAQFTRGLLDPSENALINTANGFAKAYANLVSQAKAAADLTASGLTQAALQESVKYHAFEEAGTRGIAECKVRSIILPLLADHDLRELNHYIRLLRQFKIG